MTDLPELQVVVQESGEEDILQNPKILKEDGTVPYAIMNGFSAATIYAGNIDGWDDHTIDKKTGKLNRELYENWRVRSTHNMTIFGKAITGNFASKTNQIFLI